MYLMTYNLWQKLHIVAPGCRPQGFFQMEEMQVLPLLEWLYLLKILKYIKFKSIKLQRYGFKTMW